mgnify:CR=1 FL=1
METKKLSINLDEKLGNFNTFLRKKSNWFLFVVFFVSVGYYAFLWYSYVYNAKWSESIKQEYVRTKEREVVFKKEQFDLVVAQLENRKMNCEKKIDEVPDVFKLK